MPQSVSIPFAHLAADLSGIRGDLDAATARALELEAEITALDDDTRALESRLAVTTERLLEQRAVVDAADAALAGAEARFRDRLITVYKRGTLDPLTILLTSDTLTELVSRAAILTRIAEGDSRMVSDLNVAASNARYQQSVLADLQSQDRTLKNVQEDRVTALQTLLAEQEALVAQLTVQARDALLQARQLTASTRQQWRAASIPIGTAIPRASASVDTHAELTYLISAYMPRSYQSTGRTFSAVCSWYGPGFNGRGTASGQVFNEDDLTCASRTLPFGTVLALTRGDRRVIVYVNDRGPYIEGRDLDLSKAAAQALGFSGVATVQAEMVLPIQ
jgi:rare lipoprotein A